jgi:hypothetical protein
VPTVKESFVSQRVLGGLTAAGAILVSWAVVSLPGSSVAQEAGAPVSPRWSTYLGFGGDEEFGGLTRSEAGEVFVVGTLPAYVPDMGTSVPPLKGRPERATVIVAAFQEDGGFSRWSAFGGEAEDRATDIELGRDGKLYVAGRSNSQGFGTIPFNKGEHGSGSGQDDGFIAQLEPSTLQPNWIFMLGGSSQDQIQELAVGPDGDLFVTGYTRSHSFPKERNPPPITDITTDWEAFVSRISPGADGGTLSWSRVMRGANDDYAHAIAVGPSGQVFVTGSSDSSDLFSPVSPVLGRAGAFDAFVVSLEPADGGITRATYLGGTNVDDGRALVLKGGGDPNLFVAGTTRSAGFPRGTDFSPRGADAFVVALNRNTFALTGWRVLGGPDDDEGRSLALDTSAAAAGRSLVYVGGRSKSRDGGFPLKDAFDTNFGGEWEGFVAHVEVAAGSPVLWSSWVGGSGSEEVTALWSDEQGRLLLGGATSSTDLVPPGVPGFDPSHNGPLDGGNDLYLMRVGPPDAGTPVTENPDAGVEPEVPEEPEEKGLLGWSCGASATGGAPLVLALGALAGLALRSSRREPRA